MEFTVEFYRDSQDLYGWQIRRQSTGEIVARSETGVANRFACLQSFIQLAEGIQHAKLEDTTTLLARKEA